MSQHSDPASRVNHFLDQFDKIAVRLLLSALLLLGIWDVLTGLFSHHTDHAPSMKSEPEVRPSILRTDSG